ncbi:MAG: YafY family protein [Vicinamibacterales bacterium]
MTHHHSSGTHATRLLAVLELLQTHGRLTGGALAARLGVDRRTVRRYVTALEGMGIPVATERGAAGGYELMAGYRLPPLALTDDEAVAVALGLAAVRGLGLFEVSHAVESAHAKLERVMPSRVRRRMRAVAESVSFSPPRGSRESGGPWLAAAGTAVHEQRRVRLRYLAQAGETLREVDPYGLAFVRGHWYLSGYCHLRREIRSFRLDRIEDVVSLDETFARPARFDALAHLRRSIATLPRRFSIDVLLETDLLSATRRVMPELGLLEAEGAHVRMRSEADDLEWFARELAHMPWPVRIRRPRALARALDRHARALLQSSSSR